MRIAAILFIALASCNTVKTTVTATSQSSDSSITNINRSVERSSSDNLSIKRDNGSWTRTTIYPPAASLHSIPNQGVVVIESGTYNRDQVVKKHKESSKHFNVYHHINVTKTNTQTITVTKKSRFAWLPMLLLAIGGVAAVIAVRIPLIINLILSLINLIISKFKNNKSKTP
jgi:hypothetical protein